MPRLQIPSESVSTVSTLSNNTTPAVVEEHESVREITGKEEFQALVFGTEQASLSWVCDIHSNESDQFQIGWVGFQPAYLLPTSPHK